MPDKPIPTLNRHGALLPCPFCGHSAAILTIESGDNKGGMCVECEGCAASSRLIFPAKCDVTALLKESWNTRATPKPTQEGETPDDRAERVLRELTARTGLGFDDERILRGLLRDAFNALQRELNEAREILHTFCPNMKFGLTPTTIDAAKEMLRNQSNEVVKYINERDGIRDQLTAAQNELAEARAELKRRDGLDKFKQARINILARKAVASSAEIGEEIHNLNLQEEEFCEENKNYLQQLESQLAAAQQEIEALRFKIDGVHSCSDQCQNPPCVMRRELEALRRELNES